MRRLMRAGLVAALAVAGCGRNDGEEAPPRSGAAPRPELVRVTGIPDENPTALQRKYQPMVTYLEEKLATRVEYVPVTDYGAAVQALAAGKVDFAWLGGFTHVQARVMSGAVPLCQRDIDRDFKSVFITSDPAIRSPKDLAGKTFAFGSKSSTSGHLMPRHFLLGEFGIDADQHLAGKPVYSDAHDATVKLVESGKVQAGALNIEVWQRMTRESKVDTGKVRVIWTTPGYVDYVWTARKDLGPELRDRFTRAFLELDPADPAHAAVLELQGARKFVPAAAADFDAIEAAARRVGLLKN